jgi:hypothetical protein
VPRLAGEPSSGLFGDMRGLVVEDQLDRRVGRVGGVEKLEEFDEFAAAMAILDQRMDLAGDEVDAGQQADYAVPLIFMLARESRIHAGLGRQIQRGRRDRAGTDVSIESGCAAILGTNLLS